MVDKPSELIDPWRGEAAAELRLLQYLQSAIPEADRRELAALLQLDIIETETPAKRDQAISVSVTRPLSPQTTDLPSDRHYPPKQKTLPHLYLHGLVDKAPVEQNQQPPWYADTETFNGEIESPMQATALPEPVLIWQQFWPTLRHLFGDLVRTHRLDMGKILRQAVKQQPLRRIPWKEKIRWPAELLLIVDYSRHLSPWFHDFEQLSLQLGQWFGQRIRLLICLDGERQCYLLGDRVVEGFPGCSQGAEVLYLGDLGLLDQQGASPAGWLEASEKLRQRNARVRALLVADPSDWDGRLTQRFSAQAWDQVSPRVDAASVSGTRGLISKGQTEQLLAYLSPAIELTLALVRKARQMLGYNLSVESLIIQHPALRGNSTVFQWRSKAIRAHYRKQFELNKAFDKQAVWRLIGQFEKYLPVELQIEQCQQIGKTLTSKQATFIQRLVKSKRSGTLLHEQQESLLAWIGRTASRAGDEVWSTEMHALYALYWRGTEDKKQCIVPEGVDLTRLPRWITGKAQQRMVRLVQQRNQLVIASVDDGAKGAEVARFQLTAQSSITLHGEHGNQRRALDYNSGIALPEGTERITIDTMTQALTLGLMPCPPWASAIGRDRYGLFVEVELEAIPFVMRWIPPGRFWMGSPADEPERHEDEGPRRQITFEQGFWLAETACTQELWQAVRGKNPSRFQDDPQNPVENVSWQDVIRFIEALNGFEAGFDFRLPSEAEWEYACRAGTETPFWFGTELTTDDANYNGNHPYNNGKKGEYREQTMPVESFRRNPWGLYQMHGNVWEWCEDYWHDSHEGANPQGRPRPQGESENHVCRGGSWFSGGGLLRAAYRDSWHFGAADNGFRLARGPESSSKQGAAAAMGRRSEGRAKQPHGSSGGGVQGEN